jgi:hypothetical protein
MEGLLPLIVLFGASAGMLVVKSKSKSNRNKEGFNSIVTEAVKNSFGKDHSDYVQKSASKFNKTMSLMDPGNNVFLPPNFTSDDVRKTEKDLRGAIQSALASPNEPSFNVKHGNGLDILMNAGGKGTAKQAISDCEKLKTIDCNAFDKEDFALNCGVCFQGGTTSTGSAQIGGLYVAEDDVASARAMADKMGSSQVNYTPTVGKCDANMFVTSKQQCITLQKKLACQANQSFDGQGCSQCYQDSTFKYLQDNLATDDPQLVLTGTGKLIITKVGSNEINQTLTLTSEMQVIDLPGLVEGDSLQLNVSPATASIAGYLIGLTASGDFRIDLIRVIQSDTVTGSRPRVAGVAKVGDDNYTVLRPGRGQVQMNLALINPFTFINASEQEAIDCGATPYIKNQASATFLESSPCYKKGQKPGGYSMECLQQTFISAGCTESGTAYTVDAKTASALMSDPNTGRALTASEIAGFVYNASTTAYTGIKEDGTKMTIKEWDKVSRYCTGRSITSPCDFDDKANGPLSKDCMAYLYNNQGAIDNVPGNVGPTYSGQDGSTSLNDKNNRYCTPNGSIAPVDKNGNARKDAIDLINSQYKGVDAVKAFFNKVHLEANDNTKKDEDRKQSINMCYGVDLIKPAEQVSPPGPRPAEPPSIPDPPPGCPPNPPAVVNDWNYRGCFKDCHEGRGLPNRLDNVNSIEACIEQAKAKGYTAAGNQYFGECWAGNNSDWDRMGPAKCCEPLGGGCTQHIYTAPTFKAPPSKSVLDYRPGRTKSSFMEPDIPKTTIITMGNEFTNGGIGYDSGGAMQRFRLWINKQYSDGEDNLLLSHMKKQFDKNGGKLKILVHKYDAQPESVVSRVLELDQFNDGGYYWELISSVRSSYQYGMYYPLGCRLELSITDPSTSISPALG